MRDGRRVVYVLCDDHVGELFEQAISHVEHLRAGLTRSAGQPRPSDPAHFATFATVMGISRFLIEFVRINPTVVAGLSQPELWSLGLVALGGALALAWPAHAARSCQACETNGAPAERSAPSASSRRAGVPRPKQAAPTGGLHCRPSVNSADLAQARCEPLSLSA